MRKRLRKKLRLREFAEFGFELRVWPRAPLQDPGHDVLFEALIDYAESVRLCVGGGANREFITVFVSGASRARKVTEADRDAFLAWLNRRDDIDTFRVGRLVDAWYGPFREEEFV